MKKIVLPVLNDAWMDNGVETLYSILNGIEDKSFKVKIEDNSLIIIIEDINEFKKKIGDAIEQRRSNLIVTVIDTEQGTKKEIKKDYVLIQEKTKVEGKVSFKEALYNKKTATLTTSKILDLMVEEGKRNCIICGKPFSKPMKKLQQAAYPLVTKIKSLSGIRSYKNEDSYSMQEYYDDFCPACYLRGIAEWSDDAIVYRTVPGDKSTLLLPQSNKLKELIEFKALCRSYLNKNERYQNIREEKNGDKTERTSGTFSTLLCFYEKFLVDIQGENLNKTWALMEIPYGIVKNIKFHTLNVQDSVLETMQQLYDDGIGLFSSIIKAISFFNSNSGGSPVNWDLTNQVREDISKAFIENDFGAFASSFLPQKGGHLGFSNETRVYLDKFIYKWRLKNMGLDKENLEMLKTAGKTIAVASRSHQSLLYKLDKAKDKTAILDALRQVSRRIAGLKQEEKEKYKGFIYPPSLEDLVMLLEKHASDRKFIEDLRNTLVIFSCVESSKLDYLKGAKGGER